MAEKKPEVRWIVPAVGATVVAIAALAGVPLLLLTMVLLPVAASLIHYYCGWTGTAGVCAAAAVAGCVVFPVPAIPAVIIWCGGTFAAAYIPVKKPITRPILWGAVCLAAWSAALVALAVATDGPIANGLAQRICDMIAASPEQDTILLNAYSMGYCRLEGTQGLIPAVRSMGSVVIEDQTRLQMLYSLRVTLEESLPATLCDLVVFHTALTTLLCTVLPDWRRRRTGGKGMLPSMDQWYMPRRLGRAVGALLIGWLISFMSGTGVVGYLGTLCADVFRVAFMIQGICFLQWLGKRVGVRGAMRNLWAVVLSVLAPIVPIIMGLIDQRKDARHLRPNKEAEQE